MEIRKLTATFGALQNRQLSLEKGLNIVYAPNESGKSTWCQFLRVMFYGLQGRGDTADKTRYAPWNGGALSGTMDVTADGAELTIRRTTRRATSPMGELTCEYSGTATPWEGLNGMQPGEALLGIPQSVFERSAFIGENSLSLSQTPELEKRIAALITSGDESISFTETYERLKKQLNSRRHNRTGEIPRLEDDISALQRELSHIRELNSQRAQAQAAKDALQTRVADLQDQQHRWQIITRQEEAAYNLRRQSQALSRLQQLQEKATEAEAQYQQHPHYGKTESQLTTEMDANSPRKLPGSLWRLLLLGGAIVALVLTLGFLFTRRIVPAIFSVIALLCCGAGLYAFFKKSHEVSEHNAQMSSRREILQAQIAQLHLLAQNAESAKNAYDQYVEFCDALPEVSREKPEEVEPPVLSPEEVEAQLRIDQTQLARLQSQLDILAGQLRALGNAEDIAAQLEKKQSQLLILQNEYDAIDMAMTTLGDINTRLQSRFSPKLGRRAAEIFAGITGGRYDTVLLTRELQMQAQTADDPVARTATLLSQGTIDQLYLAVRLALCDTVLPQDVSVPLILDDALLSFDDQRLHAALDYLLQESKKRQIILFSCQHREADYLKDHAGVNLCQM